MLLQRVRNGEASQSFNYPTVQRLAEHRELFAGLCGFSSDTLHVGPPDAVEVTGAAWVSGGFYTTLGLAPVAGRLLEPDDDRLGAAPVAVITDSYWNRRFARRADVIGQPFLVEGVPVTVVGVSPAGFSGTTVGERADITLPLGALPQLQPERAGMLGRGGRWLRILGRPADGCRRTNFARVCPRSGLISSRRASRRRPRQTRAEEPCSKRSTSHRARRARARSARSSAGRCTC